MRADPRAHAAARKRFAGSPRWRVDRPAQGRAIADGDFRRRVRLTKLPPARVDTHRATVVIPLRPARR